LLFKIRRSESLEATWMVGIEQRPPASRVAKSLSVKTTTRGSPPRSTRSPADGVKIAFDATSASEHAKNPALREESILSIDLTPRDRAYTAFLP